MIEVIAGACQVCVLSGFSRVQVSVALCTVARQAPLSLGFFRQVCCSGLLYSPPGDLPEPGFEPMSLMSPALADGFFTTSVTWVAFLKDTIMFHNPNLY